MATGRSSKIETGQALEELLANSATEVLQIFYIDGSTFFSNKSLQEYEKLIGSVVSLAYNAENRPFINHVILDVLIFVRRDDPEQVVVFRTCDVVTVQECFITISRQEYSVYKTLPDRFDIENKMVKKIEYSTYSKPLLRSYDMYYVAKEPWITQI